MPKLVIIGANYLQLPLVLKAKEMGFETHVFAWEEDAVCKDVADFFYPISITVIDRIYLECNKIQPQGIVSIGSDLAIVAVNTIAERLGLIGNSLDCTKVCTDKFLMRSRLSSAGLSCPSFLRLTAADSELDNGSLSYPVIVKPVDRSGSRGVSKVDEPNGLWEAIQIARSESLHGDVIVEAYIEGRELSIEAISWRGEHRILQYTDKVTTGPPNFVEMSHHQPAILTELEKNKLHDTVIAALDALMIENGASHTEIKFDKDGESIIIEVGARMGGDCIGSDLVPLSTGYDFVKAVIDVSTGEFHHQSVSDIAYSGIHYVFANSGTLRGILFKGDEYVESHEVLVPIGSRITKVIDSSQRAAYYIYKSDHKIVYDPDQLVLISKEEFDDTI